MIYLYIQYSLLKLYDFVDETTVNELTITSTFITYFEIKDASAEYRVFDCFCVNKFDLDGVTTSFGCD